MQCDRTKTELDLRGVAYNVGLQNKETDLSLNEQALELVRELGIQSPPAVLVHDAEGILVDYWGGLRPDKIKEHFGERPKAAA